MTVIETGAQVREPFLSAQVSRADLLPIGEHSPVARRYLATLTDDPLRRSLLVRGAVVGGSGAINGGYFCRALPRDFDRMDVPGWSWPRVLESYREIETDLDFGGPAHGRSGPIPVRRSAEPGDLSQRFIEAAERRGFGWIEDLNDVADQFVSGIGAVPLNIVDGVRHGPGKAYLEPALPRPNLTLLTGIRASGLRFAGTTVIGIDAIGPAGPMVLEAGRIVLCAGAIGSAHLLMLSGIGDEVMLREAGVVVRTPLPVATACIDHPEWLLPTPWPASPGRPVLETILTVAGHIEIRPYTVGFAAMTGLSAPDHPDLPQLGVVLMAPRSRGRIRLISADPTVDPWIEHRYDSEPLDIAALRTGAQLADELLDIPFRAAEPIWSTSQHLCGTAPMGSGEHAVVDERCRVRGLDNLWVIDGSVLPRIPSRGPHATIAMVAHRAAEFVC